MIWGVIFKFMTAFQVELSNIRSKPKKYRIQQMRADVVYDPMPLIFPVRVFDVKRRGFLGDDFAGSVDTIAEGAQYKSLSDVPLNSFDAAFVCMPYQGKYETVHYLLSNKKHVLAEKPLLLQDGQFAARPRRLGPHSRQNRRPESHAACSLVSRIQQLEF